MRQHLRKNIVIRAAHDDVRHLLDARHDAQPRLIDAREATSLGRQLARNVAAHEHRLQVGPEVLYLHPAINDLQRVRQLLYPCLNRLLERRVVSATNKPLGGWAGAR